MNNKLKLMIAKSTFAAYRLTESGWLEVQGRDHKVTDRYFLFDGKHYYYGNPLVKESSDSRGPGKLILATTDTKLLLPQGNDRSLYIARNFPARKDLLVIILYTYADHLYFSVITGNGSGRVHPVYLPLTNETFQFCFHFAIDAIASVDPQMVETLYAYLAEKTRSAQAEIAEHK